MNEVNLKLVERIIYLELQRHIHHELENFSILIRVSSDARHNLVFFSLYDEETERKITVALAPFEFQIFDYRMKKYEEAYEALMGESCI